MLLLLVLAGCSPDYALDRVSSPPDAAAAEGAGASTHTSGSRALGTPDTRAPMAPGPRFSPVSIDADGGSALTAEEDATGRVRRETFELGGGATTPVADFLFVVDDSASMQTIVDRVRAAFAGLGDGAAFPAEARIAVMNTLPADPADLRVAHPAARHRKRNRHGAGFLRLVDAAGIDEFLGVAPDKERRHFGSPGCAGAWFAPTDRDAAGVPCIVAATQIAMDSVRVEAGLTAFGQLLERQGDVPLFRPGAAANVIFVSDTQDPGIGPDAPELAALVAGRPDYAALADLVDVANTVSSFRVHAIAPATECAETWAHLGPVYQQAAKDAGGRTLDVCTATDYGAFVRDIVHDGAVVQRPVVALGRAADDAVVEVDGQRVGWSPSADGRAITLDHALSGDRAHVTVTYQVRPPAAPVTPATVRPAGARRSGASSAKPQR
jgi:hypothetical protein